MVGIAPLVNALTGAAAAAWEFLPWLIITIVILVIGLVIGKIVGRILKEVLLRIKLDYYVTEEKKPPVSLASIISTAVKWIIYAEFIRLGFTFPGVEKMYGPIPGWVETGFNFVPSVIGAAIILIIGFVLGEFIKNQLVRTGRPYSALTGKIILFFTLYVAVAIALPILFAPMQAMQPVAYSQYMTLVGQILLVIIIAVAAAFTLAVGLGSKDTVKAMMNKWARKSRYI